MIVLLLAVIGVISAQNSHHEGLNNFHIFGFLDDLKLSFNEGIHEVD